MCARIIACCFGMIKPIWRCARYARNPDGKTVMVKSGFLIRF